MGVAYYIEVTDNSLDLIHAIDGKSVAQAMPELNAMAEQQGVASLESFLGQSIDDIADLLGEDLAMADGVDGTAHWFDPLDGIAVIDALLNAIADRPAQLKNPALVAADLESYKQALILAAEKGAQWRLAIDF